RWLSRRLARKETDYATVRLLTSIVAFPLAWGIETWLVWRWAGLGWAAAFAVSLPLSGAVAYHYWAGLGRLRGRLRFTRLVLTRHHGASRLLAAPEAIIPALERARGRGRTAWGRRRVPSHEHPPPGGAVLAGARRPRPEPHRHHPHREPAGGARPAPAPRRGRLHRPAARRRGRRAPHGQPPGLG